MAADLVRRQVSVIAALAAKAATTIAPIVFATGGDPVKMGLIASLNRPGGNLTGIAVLSNELVGKQVGEIPELLPKADTIGFLVNPNNPTAGLDTSQLRAGHKGSDFDLRSDIHRPRGARLWLRVRCTG